MLRCSSAAMAEVGDEEGQAATAAGDDSSAISAAAAALPSVLTHALEPALERRSRPTARALAELCRTARPARSAYQQERGGGRSAGAAGHVR